MNFVSKTKIFPTSGVVSLWCLTKDKWEKIGLCLVLPPHAPFFWWIWQYLYWPFHGALLIPSIEACLSQQWLMKPQAYEIRSTTKSPPPRTETDSFRQGISHPANHVLAATIYFSKIWLRFLLFTLMTYKWKLKEQTFPNVWSQSTELFRMFRTMECSVSKSSACAGPCPSD